MDLPAPAALVCTIIQVYWFSVKRRINPGA